MIAYLILIYFPLITPSPSRTRISPDGHLTIVLSALGRTISNFPSHLNWTVCAHSSISGLLCYNYSPLNRRSFSFHSYARRSFSFSFHMSFSFSLHRSFSFYLHRSFSFSPHRSFSFSHMLYPRLPIRSVRTVYVLSAVVACC